MNSDSFKEYDRPKTRDEKRRAWRTFLWSLLVLLAVGTGTKAWGQSDLVIQSLSVSPTSGGAGSSATVSLTIRNQGSGTASTSTTNIRLSSSSSTVTTSDPLLASISTPSIAAGSTNTVSRSVTIPAGTSSGTRYVWVILDVNSTANQTNENNDKANTPFAVTSLQSDLVIQSLSVSPTSGAAGSSATVSLTIRNQGSGTASPSTTNIRLSSSSSTVGTGDPLLASINAPSIAAGSSNTVNQNVTIPAGTGSGSRFVWVILDVNSTANQSNENNDKANTPFSVTSVQSDLVIQSLSVSPTSGAAGSSATVSLTIRNQGSGTASSSTTNIRLSSSSSTVGTGDPLLASINAPSIAAGGSNTVNQNVTIPAGTGSGSRFVWVILDVNSTANQSNENNDKSNTPFTVTAGQSDLVIQSLSVSPTSGVAGSSATVSLTIRNQGSGTATSSTTNIRLSSSSSTVGTGDPLLASINAPSIAAGGSNTVNQNVTIPAGTSSGSRFVWVILDVNSTANQSNENNDKASTPFTVTSLQSDLVIQSLSVSPTSGAAGSSATVSLTIRNQGSGTASPSTTNIRLSSSSSTVGTGDPLLASISTPSIAPGGSNTVNQNVTIPAGTSSGARYVWVILDVNSTANQSNENNDKTSAPFTVTATPSSETATFVSETIADGTTIASSQSFNKSWTIRNTGTTTWNSNYRLRWVSGQTLSNHADVVIAGSVSPGSTYTFIVPMTAPSVGGVYREDWKLTNESGATIPISTSSTIWVRINVPNDTVTDKADFISQAYPDGASVPAGQGFNMSWTIRNSGSTTWNSNYRLRWVSGTSLSSHADVPVNGTVPPGSNYTFNVPMTAPAVTGNYREDWKFVNAGGVTIPVSASNTLWVNVRVNLGGQSSVTGVVTSSGGGPIAGADVRIGSNSTQSNSQGTYSISNIAAGDYTATVSKAGYGTISEPVSIPPSAQIRRDFNLQLSVTTTTITITNIATQYPARSYFLNGITHNVTFSVNVDWGGHSPAKVVFITPKGFYEDATNSTTVSRTFDMGAEFGPCGRLKVKAFSSDGASSVEKVADFVVMSRPRLVSDTQISDNGGGFYYKSGLRIPAQFDLLEELIDESVIPKDIPAFGQEQVSVTFKPLLTSEVNSNGQASFKLSATASKPGTFENKLAGYKFGVTPQFELAGRFNDSTCKWNWSGSTGIDAFLSASRTIRIPWTLYVGYLKGTLEGSAGLQGEIFDIDPPNANLKFNFTPKVRGAAGLGLTLVYALEAWVKGDARYELQYPQTPRHSLKVSIQAGYSKFIFGFEKEHELKQWNWDLLASQSGSAKNFLQDVSPSSSLPRLIPRDYLRAPGYATFQGGGTLKKNASNEANSPTQGSVSAIQSSISAIQTTVLPFSDAQLSSGGSNLYLTWLFDNPERIAINRSMAVSSSWDGSLWAEPKAIADDGTADFHPQILTFADGSALATWEDSNAIMSDNTSLETLMAGLEISASLYDPQAKTWVRTQRLTTNSHLDRSPKLAGPNAANTLLVWISNDNNDPDGAASHPNTLWSSKWDGANWTTPQIIATLPYPIVKYSVTYNGNEGHVVMAVDTDQDQKTNEDHELYRLSYDNGAWGSILRLTNDNVADDNPQLALDSKGNSVLVWLKGEEIFSSANLDTTSRKVVARLGYSLNLADLKLAATPEGKIALAWSETSGSSDSDLQAIFYDQSLDVWGNQTQLTSDPEIEKYITTAFYGQNNLIAVYDRTNLTIPQASPKGTEGGSGTLSIPAPGTTDLYMLSHTIGGDLAIKLNTLVSSPTNPRPGEVTNLTAIIANQGDNAFQNVPVSFYQGNPATGGILIGTAVVSNTLAAGSEQQVSVLWTPTSTTSPFSIYVVVDPDQIFTDANRTNNVASTQVVKSDLAIQHLRWERQGNNSAIVTARVINVGSLPNDPTTVSFRRNSQTGTLLSSPVLGPLGPDQTVDVSIQWDITGLNEAEYSLYIQADENNQIDEYNKQNNSATLQVSLNPNAPIMSFAAGTYSASENAGTTQITIIRSGDVSGTATIDYATSNGTAKEGRDYVAANGVLNFAAGEASKSFPILIIDNAFVDGARTVNLTLNNPAGASLTAQSTATLTIGDNDSTVGSNPLDVPRSFVQYDYYDFLGRYPDESGWDFWTNQITNCGSNAQCIEVQRINVSASFFLSIEFQQTGYLVERFYKAAYGNATGSSTFGGPHQLPVPIIRFDEFLRDSRRIGRDVVVLAPGWEQLLEGNKQAYAGEFVQTPRFLNAFPTNMTPAEFVDKVNQNAGNVLSASERTTAINLFSGAANSSNTAARAQAVRQVAEDADLYNAEYNRAFVLAEYYGYLRRNPNDTPEPTLDYTGYDFWLTKLNQFNGNYINAEMVKAFLSSIEYRQRFGP